MIAATQLRPTSIRLKNILCAVDFLAGSLHAFPFAASIAKHYDGQLLLEYVDPGDESGKHHRKSAQPPGRTRSEIEAALARRR